MWLQILTLILGVLYLLALRYMFRRNIIRNLMWKHVVPDRWFREWYRTGIMNEENYREAMDYMDNPIEPEYLHQDETH